jgi:hypothetical protein
MVLAHCILGKFLGVGCHCFPPNNICMRLIKWDGTNCWHFFSSSSYVMELGHMLTRSGLTYPEVSSKVCHSSFCQLGSNVSSHSGYNCFARNGGNAIPQYAGPEAKVSNPTIRLTLLWAHNPFRGNFNHWQVSRKEAGQIFFKRWPFFYFNNT